MTQEEADKICMEQLSNPIRAVSVASLNRNVDAFIHSSFYKALREERRSKNNKQQTAQK